MDMITEAEILRELKKFDTPSITNVVATYPEDREICLGLYDPWEADWYTDENGAVKFPRGHLPGVLERVRKLSEIEKARMDKMKSAEDPDRVKQILKIMGY